MKPIMKSQSAIAVEDAVQMLEKSDPSGSIDGIRAWFEQDMLSSEQRKRVVRLLADLKRTTDSLLALAGREVN
jgi:hypothetical protein